MKNSIKEYVYPNGDRQRVQIVYLDSFDDLYFLKPDYEASSFDKLCDLYENFTVKKYGFLFGKILFFRLPEDYVIPFEVDTTGFGEVFENLAKIKILFQKNLYLKNKELCFKDENTKALYFDLLEKGYLRYVKGKRNWIAISPVGNNFGFLSQSKPDAKFKVNTSFFIMDNLDLGSPYDEVSTPIGLCVKNGEILNIPQFDREVLTVDNEKNVKISNITLKDLDIEIDGKIYKGKESKIFERPKYSKTEKGGFDIVIANNKVVALKDGGETIVPSSGFVLKVDSKIEIKDRAVKYHGLEHLSFAIQVGNSVIKDNIPTNKFVSQFYKIYKMWETTYPPTMYPLDFKHGRAPRIVLGDINGKPVCLWFEGAGKFDFTPKKDSVGASLSECVTICKDLGITNAVHLDGGGSAQILIDGKRSLLISDRDDKTFLEKERAVPLGIYI